MSDRAKKRIMLTVAYDGTNYCGWQIQPNGITIEGVLNEKLSELLKEDISVIGASRTDSGVHALCNVAVFDTYSPIPGEKMSYALNQRLPEDIRIVASKEVAADFHPRHCDSIKTYEYKIWNADFIQPFNRKYTHFVYKNLDVEAMRRAAKDFLGTHCFTSFCSTHTQVQDHVRTIYSLDILKEDHLLTIRIRGNGFLYNMVRIIAGTLIKIGMHEMSDSCITSILEAKNREAAGPTAPAQGLTLVGIEYPNLDTIGKA